MPRALWKGAISFGLVHVPVELYPAAQRHSLDMDLLDRRTMAPIGYKKINKTTGKEVGAENIVKGYEYGKGQYVVLGDEDLRRANPKATQTVEILAFADGGEIEPMHDSYRDDLLARVKQKIKSGQTKEAAEPDEAEAPPRTANVIDLTALLRANVREHSGQASKAGCSKSPAHSGSAAFKAGSRRAALKTVERKRA